MKLRLQELQEAVSKAQGLRQQKPGSYKEINDILDYQGLPFVSKAIQPELISRHHNNLLTGYFDIKKTYDLLVQQYYCPTFYRNVNVYVKDCDLCLGSKDDCQKPYNNLQLLRIQAYQGKDLMDFVTSLPISINWKRDTYNSILVIFNWFGKKVYYKLVKITIDALMLAKIIINMVICHHNLSDSIVINKSLFFNS